MRMPDLSGGSLCRASLTPYVTESCYLMIHSLRWMYAAENGVIGGKRGRRKIQLFRGAMARASWLPEDSFMLSFLVETNTPELRLAILLCRSTPAMAPS